MDSVERDRRSEEKNWKCTYKSFFDRMKWGKKKIGKKTCHFDHRGLRISYFRRKGKGTSTLLANRRELENVNTKHYF